MTTGNFVAYYRVSTDRQGRSGLGLEAQQKAVEDYLNGGDWQLIEAFTEVETGKRNDRPELRKALDRCKKEKAVLVIAKLDRLARNVAFIANLMEAKVEFRAVDMPEANKLVVHIMAAFAEHEREVISERTKVALAAAKARGVELGKHGRVLAERHKAEADHFARRIASDVLPLRREGMSVRAITEELNRRNIPTSTGGRWHGTTMHRLLKRLDRIGPET